MKRLSIFLLVVFIQLSLSGQSPDVFSKIKIDLTGNSIVEVGQLGLEVDHGTHFPQKALINVYKQSELRLLDEAGIPYEIIVPDLKAYYKLHGTMDPNEASLNTRSGDCNGTAKVYEYDTPENYEYGNMGGYLTYYEALRNLDLMKEKFPNLITARMPISDLKTHQGKSIYHLVISENADQQDPDRPQILYTALHHAREPNSLSNLLFYMWFLLENYGVDAEVTHLVDNNSLFFVPILNPDGYVYNEQTDPQGGGFWRKNRYPNADGDTVGVDLNRNYGYRWFFDDQGSSSNESSETYRGVAAFSEPETENLRRLCNRQDFKIALNYHTHGNLLIHPWGFSDSVTDEDGTFKSLARMMTIDNDFVTGTGTETVGYIVNGYSDDWMYGEQDEKEKIYAYTPEIGPSFWPGETSIDQLNKSTMRHNLNAVHSLGNFGWVRELFPVTTLVNNQGSLFFQFEKSGLKDAPIKLEVLSQTPGFTIANGEEREVNLTIGDVYDFSIDYTIDEMALTASEINLIVEMDNGSFTLPIEFKKGYAADLTPDFVQVNNLDSLEGFVDPSETWGLTDQDFFSAPYSITDSPDGDYSDQMLTELYVIEPFATANADEANVKFMVKYDIEAFYDYAQFQVSGDGSAFTPLCGEYTNNDGFNTFGNPSYHGVQSAWVQETICLNDYLDSDELLFKFVLFSDDFVTADGFYFDDFTIEVIGDDYSSTEQIRPSFLTVSPNPTSEWIRVAMHPQDFIRDLTYDLINMDGTLVSSGSIDFPSQAVNLAGLPAGQYVFQVKKGKERLTHTKFLIAK